MMQAIESATASGSGGPSAGRGPEGTLVKARVEHVSRELATYANNVADVRKACADAEDKVVGMEVNVQSSIAQLTEFVLQSVNQASHAVGQQLVERDQAMVSRFEATVA